MGITVKQKTWMYQGEIDSQRSIDILSLLEILEITILSGVPSEDTLIANLVYCETFCCGVNLSRLFKYKSIRETECQEVYDVQLLLFTKLIGFYCIE